MPLPSIEGHDVLEKLGAGAYAQVYKVRCKKKKTYHAIKCFEICTLSHSAKENLITEIRLLKQLNHKNIVGLEDFFWNEKYIYIVLEYCNAGNLSTYIHSKSKLPESTCKYFLRQLASAVEYMRSNDICHFDLKPQNLLLTKNPNISLKVGDFGFAQHLKLGEKNKHIKGSPLYMAPEIVRKKQYDAKADLWSIGIILYECLFGKAPYSSNTIEELLNRIHSAEPIPIPTHTRISLDCHDLLRRLLVHDPTKRISFDDFFGHPFLNLKTLPTEKTLEKAIEIVTKAVDLDEQHNYKEAYYLYCNALQYFVPLITDESDANKRSIMRKRALSYLKRAEEIKNVIIQAEHEAAKRRQNQTECAISTAIEAATQTTAAAAGSIVEILEPDIRYKQLFALSNSSPILKTALEIGRQGELYLFERKYDASLDSYTSALGILMQFLNNEPKGERRNLIMQQMDIWMKEAESIKNLLAVKEIEMDDQKMPSSSHLYNTFRFCSFHPSYFCDFLIFFLFFIWLKILRSLRNFYIRKKQQ